MREMDVTRRWFMLAGVGFGLTMLASPRVPRARETILPLGGKIDQTAVLQHLIDEAAASKRPLHLPAGIYATGRLTLPSGTQIEGVEGRTILRSRGGAAILKTASADTVRLSGLVLDGDNQPLGMDGALLKADGVAGLDISACRFIGSSEDGVALQCVSGRVAGCMMRRIGGTALWSVECSDLAIMDNAIAQAATGLSLSGAADNHFVVVSGNVISGLFLRKTLTYSGIGIVADSGAVIRGNSIDGAPAYGILLGASHMARVTGNTIRNAYIDVATVPAADPIAC
jgi:hypothetical protein